MNERLWRLLVGLVMAAHGVGHVYFLVPALGLANWGQKVRSWLLDPIAGGALVRPVAAIVWLLATGVWIASGVGLLLGQGWWRDFAIGGAALSLVGIAIFASGLPLSPTINPVIFDVVALLALLWLGWPSTALVGS
jgi:hypothetical protein